MQGVLTMEVNKNINIKELCMDEQELRFDKYERLGAYYWQQNSGKLMMMDPHVKARYSIVLNTIKKLLRSKKLVLDVGCGDGALTALIARMGHTVYGVDTSKAGISLAQKQFEHYNLKGTFEIITSYRYPFEDDFFDSFLLFARKYLQKNYSIAL